MVLRPLALLVIVGVVLSQGLLPRHAHAGHAPHIHLGAAPAHSHDEDDHDHDAVYLPDEPSIASAPRVAVDAPDAPVDVVTLPVAIRPVFAALVRPYAIPPPPGRFALPVYLHSPALLL